MLMMMIHFGFPLFFYLRWLYYGQSKRWADVDVRFYLNIGLWTEHVTHYGYTENFDWSVNNCFCLHKFRACCERDVLHQMRQTKQFSVATRSRQVNSHCWSANEKKTADSSAAVAACRHRRLIEIRSTRTVAFVCPIPYRHRRTHLIVASKCKLH